MHRDETFRRVKSDYKFAFGEWAAQIELLRTMTEATTDEPVIDAARARAEAAEAVYRETRDELAGMVCRG